MKAIWFTQYGAPEVLRLIDTDKPVPEPKEVLIKVCAAAANPLDWHRMRGAPIIARMSQGWLKPADPRLGVDTAGRVEAVGSQVTEFKAGDEVFGIADGSFAEYVCAREVKIARKPDNVSFEAAAAVPVAAFTALQGLRDKGRVGPGQKVLINGAAGGVGTFAVQIAKAFGAEVTGVCSTRNLPMVCAIGADHVIDYTQADFTRDGQEYDVVYDAIGNRSVWDYQRALAPTGTCVIAGFTAMARMLQHMLIGPRLSRAGGKTIAFQGMATTPKQDLLTLKALLEEEKIVPVIDRCYPLAETAAAIGYLEQGHARGKVVISLQPPAS